MLDDEGLNALSGKSKPYPPAAFSSTTGRMVNGSNISFPSHQFATAVGSNRTQVPSRNVGIRPAAACFKTVPLDYTRSLFPRARLVNLTLMLVVGQTGVRARRGARLGYRTGTSRSGCPSWSSGEYTALSQPPITS